MNYTDLAAALHRLKVETGSLACLGCGYEHSCAIHGCAILREAEELAASMGRAFNEETVKKMIGAPEWIPVSERLPEPMEWALCRCADKNMRVLRYDNVMDDWDFAVFETHLYAYDDGFVTHWMPLPEPPKEVAADAGD